MEYRKVDQRVYPYLTEKTPSSFLFTKLNSPPIRPDNISRSKLIQRLNQSLSCKLTLLSAPAGYGKTSLLSEWVNQLDIPVAWLTLDREDNDYFRFYSCAIAALRTIAPDLVANTPEVLAAAQISNFPAYIPLVMNQLAQVTSDFVFVLDDYHHITCMTTHSLMLYTLEHIPPQMHLVISSRRVPPIPIASLHTRRETIELGVEDLRFTQEEAKMFFTHLRTLDISRSEVISLHQKCEGWIACMQLAAISMEGQTSEQRHRFISALGGMHPRLKDFIIEEILSHQPKKTQNFLLKTSILNQLTSELCEEIAGQGDAGEMLRQLEQCNLIQLLDNRYHWYRYHNLFSVFLRAQLEEEVGIGGVMDLHRKASEWYERKYLFAEAVNHAFASQETQRALILLNANKHQTNLGEHLTWQYWLADIPEDMLAEYPEQCLHSAYCCMLTKDFEAVERPLSIAEKAWVTQGECTKLARVYNLRSFMARYKGDISEAIRLGEMSLDVVSDQDMHTLGCVLVNLGAAYHQAGRAREAEVMMRTGPYFLLEHEDFYSAQIANSLLGRILATEGKLNEAARVYQEVITYTDPKVYDQVVASHICLGELCFEWNKLDNAEYHLSKSIEPGVLHYSGRHLPEAYITFANLLWVRGNKQQAFSALSKALSIARNLQNDVLVAKVKACHAKLMIKKGDLAAAKRWFEGAEIAELEVELHYEMNAEYFTLARLFLSESRASSDKSKLNDALSLLDRLQGDAEANNRMAEVVECLSLKALSYWEQGKRTRAMESLFEALNLAEPEGYIRTFLDEDQPMYQLLSEASVQSIAPEYVNLLLQEFQLQEKDQLSIQEGLTIDILGERELDVLRLIAKGTSTREIAEDLFISWHTVRTHVKNIYQKLGVKNRFQAIEQARILDIL
jgi:LuxR family maltose regulon positive regulatory protein